MKNESRLNIVKNSNVFKNPRELIEHKQSVLDSLVSSLKYSSNALVMKSESRLDLVKNSSVFKGPDLIIKDKNNAVEIKKDPSAVAENPYLPTLRWINMDRKFKTTRTSFLSIFKKSSHEVTFG